MVFAPLFFYLFASGIVISSLLVILVKNPVHSVLLLLLAFLYAAGLIILLDAELIAVMLVIVYMGAVGVLFLFVVMMLDINFAQLKAKFLSYLPFCLLIAAVLALDLYLVLQTSVSLPHKIAESLLPIDSATPNKVKLIGMVLYTNYALAFQIAGLILLVAMIGAITLTVRQRPRLKRQNIAKQLARTQESGMTIVKVQIGAGISDL